MIKKILLSQSAPVLGKSPYAEVAGKYGIEVLFHPFTKTEQLDNSFIRKQIISIKGFTAILLTSRMAVDIFFRFVEISYFTEADKLYYFCSSESVAKYLQKYSFPRKRKTFAGNGKLESLEPFFEEYKEENFLCMISEVQREELSAIFNKHTIKHKHCVCYKNVDNPLPTEELLSFDAYLFFNATAVRVFSRMLPNFQQGEKIIGCFGEKTLQVLNELGLRADIKVLPSEAISMSKALENYILEEQKKE